MCMIIGALWTRETEMERVRHWRVGSESEYKFSYNLMLSTLFAPKPLSQEASSRIFHCRRCRRFCELFFFSLLCAVHSFRVAFVSLWCFTLCHYTQYCLCLLWVACCLINRKRFLISAWVGIILVSRAKFRGRCVARGLRSWRCLKYKF